MNPTGPAPESPATPNPGSDLAILGGCTCVPLDNNHGRYEPWPGWWITAGCPLHDIRRNP